MIATEVRNAVEWPGFLTVAEVARILRVSNMTVYRLIESGELPGKRVGRNFRVPEVSLKNYLDVTSVTPERENISEQ